MACPWPVPPLQLYHLCKMLQILNEDVAIASSLKQRLIILACLLAKWPINLLQ